MNEPTIDAEGLACALAEACRRAHAEVLEFTVAPRTISPDEPWDGHDWLIEFAEPPRAPAVFTRALDEALGRSRAGSRMGRTVVIELPAGTFHRWRHQRARRAGSEDVPSIAVDRGVAEDLLAIAAMGPVPLMVVGA